MNKKKYTKECAYCGKIFSTNIPNAKYCSQTHGNRARSERSMAAKQKRNEQIASNNNIDAKALNRILNLMADKLDINIEQLLKEDQEKYITLLMDNTAVKNRDDAQIVYEVLKNKLDSVNDLTKLITTDLHVCSDLNDIFDWYTSKLLVNDIASLLEYDIKQVDTNKSLKEVIATNILQNNDKCIKIKSDLYIAYNA